MKNNKTIKIIALLIIIALVIPITQMFFNLKNIKTREKIKLTKEDYRIINEISKTTGKSVNSIVKLRERDFSWEDIIKYSKNSKKSDIKENTKDYKELGYTDEQIQMVKTIVNKVYFQLEDLNSKVKENSDSLALVINNDLDPIDNDEIIDCDDKEILKNMYKKFNENNAVYYLLKLKEDFDMYEYVMDEYLLSLQLDIDFNMYIEGKKEYLSTKQEKVSLNINKKIFNMQTIELILLEYINKKSDNLDLHNNNDIVPSNNTIIENNIKPNNIKPQNPLDSIKKEIDSINPMEKEGR